jgi:hypothetical protein
MRARIFLRLSRKWALGSDCHQWIVYQRKKRRDQCYWNPVSYVGSTKAILRRVLLHNGTVIDTEGEAALAALPDTFKIWRDTKSGLRRRQVASAPSRVDNSERSERNMLS